jgi:hypothetical protein
MIDEKDIPVGEEPTQIIVDGAARPGSPESADPPEDPWKGLGSFLDEFDAAGLSFRFEERYALVLMRCVLSERYVPIPPISIDGSYYRTMPIEKQE